MTVAEPELTSLAGLSSDEVAAARRSGQVNDYRPPTSRSVRQILATNIFTRFNALLGSLFVVMLVVGPLRDSLFGLTLIANTAVGVVQELRAKRTLDRLSVVTAPLATVVRDGSPIRIKSSEIVLGDLLTLGAGDEVVVDGTALQVNGLRLDESLLSGESRPMAKAVGADVLSGSLVVAGSGLCRVTAVGEASYAARLAVEARRFRLATSELRDGMNQLLRVITWVLVPLAGLLIWSQFAHVAGWRNALRGMVAGTVTMVPEGLILLGSVAFAVGGLRLVRRRVLPRELASIEGLARVDTLCIDKTGTLTTGNLQVLTVDPVADPDSCTRAIGALARIEARPNATSRALAEHFPEPPAAWVAVRTYPFDSAVKWSGADFGPEGSWVIGAPDILLPPGHPLRDRAEHLAASGQRGIALARGIPDREPVAAAALIVLGDELRADAADTLAYLREQGVTVKVISGDHPATVGALAARVGLAVGTPVDARTLPPEDPAWTEAVAAATVFGRVTPQQKQRMVTTLQAQGHVVAMTGDGVNDILAMKDADVGMAMGSGAPATRAVAQLVLLDDSFAAVPDIVGEGRRVIANMERVANLFLSKTVYAALLALAVGIARLPFPFLPRHLTLVSTLTIGVPAFVLSLAPNARRARPHFLNRVVRFAVPSGVITAAATYVAYWQAREEFGERMTASRTLATVVLFVVALWILAVIVRAGNRRQSWLVPAMALLMILSLLIEPVRQFFALGYPHPELLLSGLGVATVFAVLLSVGWRISGAETVRPSPSPDPDPAAGIPRSQAKK